MEPPSRWSHRYTELLQELTANFDEFPEEPMHSGVVETTHSQPTSAKGSRREKDNQFIGYTYKRKQKFRVQLTADTFSSAEEVNAQKIAAESATMHSPREDSVPNEQQ